MYKIEHVFKKNDEERYAWIVKQISTEGASNDGTKKLYYYGSNYVYNNICTKLMNDFGTTYNLLMVTKDTGLDHNSIVFTDDLLFEIYYIWPTTTSAMKHTKGLKWYVSILNKEQEN